MNLKILNVTYLTGELITFAKTALNLTYLVMPQHKKAKKPLNKGAEGDCDRKQGPWILCSL